MFLCLERKRASAGGILWNEMNIFSARKLSRYLLLSRTGCFNDPCILTRKALSTAAAATAAATATASPSPSLVGSSIRLPPGPSLHHFILQAGLAVPSSDQTSLDLDAMQVPYLSGTLDKSVQQGRIYIESYGCQMNVNDLEIVLAILKKAGYTDVVEKADNADVILINTCAIRDNAENKIWHRLNYFKHIKLKRYKNGETAPKVAVLGCMAERLKEKLVEANKMVDVVCGPDAYRDLPRLLASVDQGYTAVNTILSLEETYADVTPVRISKSSISAFVSIMRGCNNMCSFCIVPFTRGRERSRPVASIVDEVKQLRDQGLKEVWLLGQNVNSYNDVLRTPVGDSEADDGGRTRPWSLSSGFSSICKNKKDGLRFSDLLDRLSSLFPDIRFRFTSPHPKDFPDELLFLMRERPNVCKSIHLPAQSGSTKILERMRRGYTREAYLSLVERIRSIVPDCSLSSDFIAGFCGETEEDHADTLSLIEAVGYDMAYMFAYSLREKTHAHRNYEDDVPELVKQRRLSEMISTFRHTTVPRYESQLGTTQLVLITGPNKRNSSEWIGLSDKGHRVVFPNQLLPIACSSGAYDGNDNSHDKQCDTQLVSDLSEPSMMLDSSNNIGRGPPKFRWPCPGDYVEVRITETSAASLRGYPVNCTDLISFLSQHSPSMA